MSRTGTPFAPEPRRLPRAGVSAPTLLSVTALAGIPQFVREAFGESVLQQANRAAMLDIEAIEDCDCFIPHATMTAFLAEVARRAREPALGLMLAPFLSLENYGCWGRYILAGETLRAAMMRSMQAIGYHSRGDRSVLRTEGALARLCYFSAARGREGYDHVAIGSIGVMLNLCQAYLSPNWRPLRIDLDIPRPRRLAPFENVFQCELAFDAPVAAVWLEAWQLETRRRPAARDRLISIADVARARLEPGGRNDLVGVVSAHIWAQVLTGRVTLDSTARALETSTRSLQRSLSEDGTDFRTLVNRARARRARELIAGTSATMSEIAAELGYNTPANFARAFRKEVGLSPSDFRRRMAGTARH